MAFAGAATTLSSIGQPRTRAARRAIGVAAPVQTTARTGKGLS